MSEKQFDPKMSPQPVVAPAVVDEVPVIAPLDDSPVVASVAEPAEAVDISPEVQAAPTRSTTRSAGDRIPSWYAPPPRRASA